VYVVAGVSGQLSPAPINHPAMYWSTVTSLGSLVLDVGNNSQTTRFLDKGGVIRDVFTIQKGAAPPTAPAITTASLVDGQLSANYAATLAGTGGVSPYSWSLAAGSLPAGLTLATSGVISGQPTGPAGTTSFTVRVTGNNGASSTRVLSINVVAASSAPGAFVKSAPANNAIRVSRSPTLKWTASAGATSYEYCYDQLNNSVCDGTWTSAGSSLQVAISGLPRLTRYFWHVRARNSFGTTESSSGFWWNFTTNGE
jgi:hypothetical protein